MILNLDNYNDAKHKEFLENISDSTLELSFKSFSSLISFLKEIGDYTSARRVEIKQKQIYYYKWYYGSEEYLMYNNIKVKFKENLEYVFCHLRKNNTFKLIQQDNFLIFPWHLFYKEIIRVCDRDNKTSVKKKLLHQAKNFKLLALHGQLENDNFTKLTQEDDYLSYHEDELYITIQIHKEDKTLKINEEQLYDLYGSSLEFIGITYEQLIIKLTALFMLFGKVAHD